MLSHKQAGATAKCLLAQPLLDINEEYDLPYLNYAKEWQYLTTTNGGNGLQLKASEVSSSWKFSLPRRLQ